MKKRDLTKDEITRRVKLALGNLIYIEDIPITNFDLSDQLEHAIEQKVVREQEALAKQFELEREKKEADITLVKAEAEAKAVKVKGEALKESPEVIQLEIVKRWNGKSPQSVVVGSGGANVLLPLSK